MIKNPRSILMSALLGASLSVGLVSAAGAGDGHDSRGHNNSSRRTLQAANGIDVTQGGRTVATAGVLVRSASEFESRLAMSGLEPYGAYTIWWMIFNRPANCIKKNECGLADLADPAQIRATGGTVFNGTGFIAASDGTANVSVHLKDGPLPTGNGVAAPQVAGYLWPGNGLNAYVVNVVRTHGPAIAGKMDKQISTIEPNIVVGGDCALCQDHQAVIFGLAPRTK